jgi:tetratricopeptide (TPR) repeat protein
MALIAERLHGGGQSMVPSDTVIALLRDQSSQPASAELTHLVATTDAQFVLAAEAQTTGTRWTVSLHTILGVQPPLTAVGEAHDVLEAAREATDRMLLELGFANSDGLSTEPGLQRLLQQIEAARLSQQTDVARALIESADPELRRSPEVRLQSARIEFYNHNLDAAQATFDSLIDEIGADNDPVLRARALNGRAAVYLRNGDPDAAAPLLSEAARILPAQNHTLEYLSSIQNNSAVMADMREDPNAASLHFAQARTILEGSGDVKGLATLDQNEGTLELRRERYTEALRHLESAAQRKAAVQDIGGELRALVCMIQAQLGLLDPQAALAIEPRVNELLARTTNEQLTAYAKIQLAYLMSELGRIRASESLMNEVLRVSELSDIPPAYGKIALLQRAERMAKVADFAAAAELAAKVVDGLADHTIGYEERARAWLLVIRANLALDRLAIADEARNAMAAWARDRMARSPKIYAALADAEIASFAGRTEAARTAFERAFSLADAGHAPVHLLRVAQGYVPWLLREDHATLRNRERARFLAERLAGYAQQHYGAALLQLYVHHSAGISPTWRASLARVTSLAGERQVPPALLEAPKSVGL